MLRHRLSCTDGRCLLLQHKHLRTHNQPTLPLPADSAASSEASGGSGSWRGSAAQGGKPTPGQPRGEGGLRAGRGLRGLRPSAVLRVNTSPSPAVKWAAGINSQLTTNRVVYSHWVGVALFRNESKISYLGMCTKTRWGWKEPALRPSGTPGVLGWSSEGPVSAEKRSQLRKGQLGTALPTRSQAPGKSCQGQPSAGTSPLRTPATDHPGWRTKGPMTF